MFIYKTTNNVNGMMYVGMCSRDDPKYLGSGKRLKAAIKKYGRDSFTRDILEECDDFQLLCERELYWINALDAVKSDKYYNLSYGGYGGNGESMKEYWSKVDSEDRKKHRNWKGHFIGLDQSGDKHISKIDPNWSEKLSEQTKHTWDSYTDEERKARGKITSERRRELGTARGKNNPMYGRSAVKEKNLKWYTNGADNLYVTEGTQPESYRRGRTMQKSSRNK